MFGEWEWRGIFQAEGRRWNSSPRSRSIISSARCEETPQGKRLGQSEKQSSHICCQKISPPLQERTGNQRRGDTESALRQTWFWLWSLGTSVLFGKPAHIYTFKESTVPLPSFKDTEQWNCAAFCLVPPFNHPSSQEMESNACLKKRGLGNPARWALGRVTAVYHTLKRSALLLHPSIY